MTLYLGVLLLMLVKFSMAWLFVRRMVRHSVLIRDARARALLERITGDHIPELRESGSISVPVTAVCFVPKILLPAGWRVWDDAKLEAALVHELAHVRRRDAMIALLAGFNRCIYWFHPLAWWMERRLAWLAEQAADDCSILVLGDRERYASALLDMAAAVRAGRGRFLLEPVAMAKSSEVRRRIERILDRKSVVSRGVTKGRWIAVVLAAVPLLFGAAAIQLETLEVPAPSAIGRQPSPAIVFEKISKVRALLTGVYEKWLQEDVLYIITEKERETFQRLTSDEARERFIEQFWLAKDPTPGTAANEAKYEHYRRIAYANERFAWRVAGWRADRGRTYIILGPPDEMESHPSGGKGRPPYEIWRYRSTNVELEFVDPTMTGEYRLGADDGERVRTRAVPGVAGDPCFRRRADV